MKLKKSLVFLQYFAAAVITVYTLAPFVWLIISSIFYQRDLTTVPFNLFPKEITLQRYLDIFTNANNEMAYSFKVAILNSLIVAGSVTLIALVAGSLASYAFARLRFPGRNNLLYLFLFTFMIPPVVIVIPLYLLLSNLQMLILKPLWYYFIYQWQYRL